MPRIRNTGYLVPLIRSSVPIGHCIQNRGIKVVYLQDSETLGKLEQVMDLFKESLEDEDTYIYLSAINGLVACAR
jgi:hypothetical protein